VTECNGSCLAEGPKPIKVGLPRVALAMFGLGLGEVRPCISLPGVGFLTSLRVGPPLSDAGCTRVLRCSVLFAPAPTTDKLVRPGLESWAREC
jgi:hypothetical protein